MGGTRERPKMRTFQLGVLLGLSPGIFLILSILAADINWVTGASLWVAAGLGVLHGVGALLSVRFAPRTGRKTVFWPLPHARYSVRDLPGRDCVMD